MNAEDVLGVQVVNQSSVAAFVFLAYDTCLTLADEVEHIWSKPHSSPTKWLFLVLRWFTLVALISTLFTGMSSGVSSTSQCRARYIFHSAALQLVIGLMEVILAQRVYALYDKSRVVGGGLLIAFTVEHVVMVVSLAITAPRVTFTAFCNSTGAPPIILSFAVAPILYELALLVLTLARMASHARAIGWRRTPLLRLLVRDGLWAFFFAFAGYVLEAIVYVVIAGPENGLALGWQYAVAAFSGCRLVLNMHTDPALARGPGLSPAQCPRAGAEENAFALTTFLPTLSSDDGGVELYEAGRQRVETVRRNSAWNGKRTSV